MYLHTCLRSLASVRFKANKYGLNNVLLNATVVRYVIRGGGGEGAEIIRQQKLIFRVHSLVERPLPRPMNVTRACNI